MPVCHVAYLYLTFIALLGGWVFLVCMCCMTLLTFLGEWASIFSSRPCCCFSSAPQFIAWWINSPHNTLHLPRWYSGSYPWSQSIHPICKPPPTVNPSPIPIHTSTESYTMRLQMHCTWHHWGITRKGIKVETIIQTLLILCPCLIRLWYHLYCG